MIRKTGKNEGKRLSVGLRSRGPVFLSTIEAKRRWPAKAGRRIVANLVSPRWLANDGGDAFFGVLNLIESTRYCLGDDDEAMDAVDKLDVALDAIRPAYDPSVDISLDEAVRAWQEFAEVAGNYGINATVKTYQQMPYDEDNFYLATMADWSPCERPNREPDHESNSGSCYWYTPEGVIRESDHWGQGVASCDWYIDGGWYRYGMSPRIYARNERGRVEATSPYPSPAVDGDGYEPVTAYCPWDGFRPVDGGAAIC